MKNLLMLCGALALSLTLASAEMKCGEGKCGGSDGTKTEKKCNGAKADDKKCNGAKCDSGKMEIKKPKCNAGKCGS